MLSVIVLHICDMGTHNAHVTYLWLHSIVHDMCELGQKFPH